MRFRRKFGHALRAVALAAAALGFGAGLALAQNTAVIPKQVIYPGETISSEQLDVVDPQAIHAAVEAAWDQLAAALRDDWAWAFAHIGFDVWEEGVAVLSRHPITQVRARAYAQGGSQGHPRELRQGFWPRLQPGPWHFPAHAAGACERAGGDGAHGEQGVSRLVML